MTALTTRFRGAGPLQTGRLLPANRETGRRDRATPGGQAGGLLLDRRAALEPLAREVLGEAVVGGAGVRLHPLEARDARGDLRDCPVRVARQPLPGHRLEDRKSVV